MTKGNALKQFIAAPLFVVPLLAANVLAQTTSTNSALDRVRIDVVPPLQPGATPGEILQDPLTYCYFANKSYSMGAKLNGQVCVRPKDEPGVVSSAPAPLKWVSAAEFARGRY